MMRFCEHKSKPNERKYFILSLVILFIGFNLSAQIDNPPVIDGTKDAVWENASYFVPTKLVKNTPGDDGPTETDLSAQFYTLWDQDTFYLLVEVKDNLIYTGRTDIDHQNDNIEVYFDLNNSKLTIYDGIDDDQIRFIHNRDTVNTKRGVWVSKLNFESVITPSGYIYEMAFPWSALTSESFNAVPDAEFGFDLMVTDNDGTPTKDYILAWNASTNDAWQFTSIFGTMKLLANGTTAKVIGDDQPAVHDEYKLNEMNVTEVIYVDRHNAQADDNGDGSSETPFATIAKALAAAADSAGKGVAVKVLIEPGIYREAGLSILKKGNAYKFMNTEVVIEGAVKGAVIISGSEVWNDGWTSQGNNTYTHEWLYEVSVEKPWGDRGPTMEIASRREMIFVDGYWMKQVMTLGELNDNCFYVDEDNDLMYVKVADTIDFEGSDKEIGLNGDGETAPWPPSRLFTVPIDKDKVVLRNLVFEHANMRLSEAAIKIQGWKVLMEDCEVRWTNGLGVSISGGCEDITLNNNIIDHNGGAGLTTWGVEHLKLKGNSTSNNNWRGHLGYYHSHAVGGIKFHHARHVLVEDHVSSNNWTPGLWTDLEIIDITFNNCVVENNYGPGFLIEISSDVYINNCVVKRNIPGVRCHSSHDVYFDSTLIQGNAVQFTVYKDHRDFTTSEWTSQFDGRVWDKTPNNWNITNCTIIGEDDPTWQAYADAGMPDWINYTNPGYQAFWHFSHADFMSTFFGGATIAYENNTWTHPATNTPFKNDKGNALTLEQWELWIAGFATGAKAVAVIDIYARTNDASPLTALQLTNAGGTNVIAANLPEYMTIVANADSVPDLNALQDIIDLANSFATIRDFADNDDASALTVLMLFECGVTFRSDRLEWYKYSIENVSSADIPDIAALQELLNNAVAGVIQSTVSHALIYPNPATDIVHFQHPRTIRVEIFDLSGKRIASNFNSNGVKSVDVSKLSKGSYLIIYSTLEHTNVERLIIK